MRASEATAGTSAEKVIRVMIVDDQEMIRSGIRFSLLAFRDLALVAEAENGQEALTVLDRMRDAGDIPDVILIDMLMPGMDGVATTRAILDRHPGTQVIVLTGYEGRALAQDALLAGATACLPKDATLAELGEAIRAAHAGGVTMTTATAGAPTDSETEALAPGD